MREAHLLADVVERRLGFHQGDHHRVPGAAIVVEARVCEARVDVRWGESTLTSSGDRTAVSWLQSSLRKKYLFPPNLVLLFPLHNMTYCVNIVKILRISR